MEYIGFDRDGFQSFRNLKDYRPLDMLNLVQQKASHLSKWRSRHGKGSIRKIW